MALLDSYAGADLSTTGAAHARWRAIAARIADLERDEQDRLRLLDLWKFQSEEIGQADLKAGEDEALETEKRVLANSERIHTAAMSVFDHLYESEGSASEQLRAAAKQLEDLARFDDRFREQAAALESARLSVEDIGTSLRDYADGIQSSPERLAEVEDRLALIDRLKRKYGKSLEEVIAYGEELARKLNEMENKDEVLRVLKKELASAASDYLEAARALSRKRYEAAKKLEKTVEAEINDLAMKARFKIEIGGTDEESNWTASGFDQVLYMISANPGEPLGPVDEIASGGELSRVMLALKASVEAGKTRSKKDPAHQRTLVFDEIDTGIGGRAAEAVGKKLKTLSKTKQVLCITHLPQIASFGDHHYLIEKKVISGRTRTSVRALDRDDRTEEIARMLSGAKLTETSLKHAEQMLKANG
jgi:DNA repair protein RecN (Recombination protein N)